MSTRARGRKENQVPIPADPPEIELKDKIAAYFKKWEWLATSYGWKFDVEYCETRDMPKDVDDAAMMTQPEFQYLHAYVWVDTDLCADYEDSFLQEAVVHELTHLLLSPIQDEKERTLVEYTVTTISRIFLGMDKANGEKKEKKESR